jgi:hypothetical protein
MWVRQFKRKGVVQCCIMNDRLWLDFQLDICLAHLVYVDLLLESAMLECSRRGKD